MVFATDKQTLDDLNIFGKHGGESVFNVYNRCATRGGAALLEDAFRYPLCDAEAINHRAAIIHHFILHKIEFPFESTLFDAVEPYLANTDERTKLVAGEQSISKKISHLIAPDAATAAIYKGIESLLALLKGLQGFDKQYKESGAIAALLATLDLTQHDMVANDAQFRFRHRDTIQKLLRHIYQVDLYCAVARVAGERGFVLPKALPRDQNKVMLDGVYHPQVPNAVPNNLQVTPGNNVLFLTGANMAGKSTFMKSLSIALYVAHMGFPIAAKRMEFSVMDGMYTTINLPDNLGMGASHFYAEVLRVKKMAQELGQGKKLFIVFDELFRGTNVKDAYEATVAVTAAFAKKKNSLFILSTHIIEAGEVLTKRCNNVRCIYLPTRMNGKLPVYTYTLEEGITGDRHGMVIIRNEGILEILEAGLKTLKAV